VVSQESIHPLGQEEARWHRGGWIQDSSGIDKEDLRQDDHRIVLQCRTQSYLLFFTGLRFSLHPFLATLRASHAFWLPVGFGHWEALAGVQSNERSNEGGWGASSLLSLCLGATPASFQEVGCLSSGLHGSSSHWAQGSTNSFPCPSALSVLTTAVGSFWGPRYSFLTLGPPP
jgi:hypothetical protein